VSSGTITLGSGAYLIAFSGTFMEMDSDVNDYFVLQLRHNGAIIAQEIVNEQRIMHVSFSRIISSVSSQTIDVFANEQQPHSSLTAENVALSIIKIG